MKIPYNLTMDVPEQKKTGQKKSVEQLRETKEYLQALYDASPT
jgi:hypothetical protein